MTPYQFALLAGVLAGLGAARLRHPAEIASRSGTVGFLAAAAGTALLSGNVGIPVGQRILDLTGLSSAAVLLTHLLLITAAVAGCVHLLDRLVEDARAGYAAIAVSAIAAAVVVWQWLTELAHPSPGVPAETKWYLVAFFAGLALPLLIVFGASVRARVQSGYVWATVLAVASATGSLWCIWRATNALAPDVAAKVPTAVGGLFIVITGLGLWSGNFLARAAAAEPIEDAPAHDEAPADTGDFPVIAPEPEPEPEPLPEPVDPVAARERAVAVAAALAGQLSEVGRDTAVAVGVNADKLVFCTADGLGFLPEGGAGSTDLAPLITCVPTEFAAQWIGCAHPQMPLLAAAEQGYVAVFDAVATVGPGGDLTIDDLGEIEAADLDAPRSKTDAIAVSETHSVLAQLRDTWGVDPAAEPSKLAEQVAAQRWTTWPNPEYPSAWAAELLARAAADLESGDVDSARYVLRCALRIPRPVPGPVTSPAASTSSAGAEPATVLESLGRSTAPSEDRKPASSTPPPARATAIAAALSKQIPGDAEIAVSVAADGTAVFATSDGLGHLPEGAHAGPQLAPLITLVSDTFLAQWLGCDSPHEAILAAVKSGVIAQPEELVTTCVGSSEDQVVSVSEQDLAAAAPYDLPWPRQQADSIDAGDVVTAYSEVTGSFGFPKRPPAVEEQAAAALRWTTTPNPEYAAAWARYLISAAEDAVSRDDNDSARYLLRNALRIPAVSKAPSS